MLIKVNYPYGKVKNILTFSPCGETFQLTEVKYTYFKNLQYHPFSLDDL